MRKQTRDQEEPTPLPGEPLSTADATRVFEQLVRMFRNSGEPNPSRPLHCDLREKGDIFWGRVFDSDWIADHATVYFVEETGLMQRAPQEVRTCSMLQVRDYLRKREPWEFADIYIFDDCFDRCIVITHDDETYLSVIATDDH